MAVMFSTVAKDLGPLDTHMATHSYVCGWVPTQEDVGLLTSMTLLPNPKQHPHAARWHRHMMRYTTAERALWPLQSGGSAPAAAAAAAGQQKAATAAPAAATKKCDDDDDDFDLFGEQTEEEKKALQKKAEEEKAKLEKKDKKEKKPVINKSLLVFEITPMSSDTNFDEIERLVREIKVEGLEWGEKVKKVPMSFGLFKLQVSAVIIDDLVNTEEVVEKMIVVGLTEEQAKKKLAQYQGEDVEGDNDVEGGEDEEDVGLIQSCNIASFNKL